VGSSVGGRSHLEGVWHGELLLEGEDPPVPGDPAFASILGVTACERAMASSERRSGVSITDVVVLNVRRALNTAVKQHEEIMCKRVHKLQFLKQNMGMG